MTGIPFTKIGKEDFTAQFPEVPHVRIAYPPALRKQLADLDLQGKREDSAEAVALILEARGRMKTEDGEPLDASWQDGPCPIPRDGNPKGTKMVWWRMV